MLLTAAVFGTLLGLQSCKSTTATQYLSVVYIRSGGSSLSASGVDWPVDSTIRIKFNRPLDSSTVAANLVFTYDTSSTVVVRPRITLSYTDSIVTIHHPDSLITGIYYYIVLSPAMKARDGSTLAATAVYKFQTSGIAAVAAPQPKHLLAFWNFHRTTNLTAGNGSLFSTAYQSAFTYGTDRYGRPDETLKFNGTNDILEINNGDKLVHSSSTMAYWLRWDTAGSPQDDYVFGVNNESGFYQQLTAANGTALQQTVSVKLPDGTFSPKAMWYNGSPDSTDATRLYRYNLQAIGGVGRQLYNRWAHIVWVSDSAGKLRQLYINGLLVAQDKYTDFQAMAPLQGNDNLFVLGFWHGRYSTVGSGTPWGNFALPTANHFKGELDDFRIWDTALTDDEVTTLYNRERQ